MPNDGCLNFVDENDEVLLSGFGRKGKAKGDIPGVRFKVVKVSGVGGRRRRRSLDHKDGRERGVSCAWICISIDAVIVLRDN